MATPIKFLKNPKLYAPENAFTAHLSNIGSRESLLRQLYDKLELPAYFGFNWDALSDCLRDLHWIRQRGIVIVHDDALNLAGADVKNYLEIITDAVDDWKKDEAHYLEIVFPEQERDRIVIYL